LALKRVEGPVKEAPQAIVGVVEEFGALASELADEVGIVVSPAVEGAAIDADGGGDVGELCAGEEEGDGGLLGGSAVGFLLQRSKGAKKQRDAWWIEGTEARGGDVVTGGDHATGRARVGMG